MTVKELIDELKTYPLELEVHIAGPESGGTCDGTYEHEDKVYIDYEF